MKENCAENVNHMMACDAFSRWMGIEILRVHSGYCLLRMRVRADMLNGFGIAHGGICFSLADTCMAFAANTHGKLSLTLKADISWPEPAKEGEVLLAESKELIITEKSATYDVEVRRESDSATLALFRGLVHRSGKPVIPNNYK